MEQEGKIEAFSAPRITNIHCSSYMSVAMDNNKPKVMNPSIYRYAEYIMDQLAWPRTAAIPFVKAYIMGKGAHIKGTVIERVRS